MEKLQQADKSHVPTLDIDEHNNISTSKPIPIHTYQMTFSFRCWKIDKQKCRNQRENVCVYDHLVWLKHFVWFRFARQANTPPQNALIVCARVSVCGWVCITVLFLSCHFSILFQMFLALRHSLSSKTYHVLCAIRLSLMYRFHSNSI